MNTPSVAPALLGTSDSVPAGVRGNMSTLGEQHALDVQEEREPDLGDFGQTWVQNKENQKALLDCFADHLKPECCSAFFYAKQVPFV